MKIEPSVLTLYAIVWRNRPCVRLTWTFREYPTDEAIQNQRIGLLKYQLNRTKGSDNVRNKELVEFLHNNPDLLDNMTFNEVKFIKLEEIHRSKVSKSLVIEKLRDYESSYIRWGYTSLNFSQFGVRFTDEGFTNGLQVTRSVSKDMLRPFNAPPRTLYKPVNDNSYGYIQDRSLNFAMNLTEAYKDKGSRLQ